MLHIVEENTSTPGWKTLGKESQRQIRNIFIKKIIHSEICPKCGKPLKAFQLEHPNTADACKNPCGCVA